LRGLVRAHKAEVLATLAGAQIREPAHADGEPDEHAAPAIHPVPDRGTDCTRCAHLTMRCEIHEGTRRVFWWRCARGHELLEARSYGERTLLAPPECDQAADFALWTPETS
jgi:hypothetical protein